MTEQEKKLLDDLIAEYRKAKLNAKTESLRKRFKGCVEGLKTFKHYVENQEEPKKIPLIRKYKRKGHRMVKV